MHIKNRIINFATILLSCFLLAAVSGCKVNNPAPFSFDQNKVSISVPDDLDADVYDIYISSETYSLEYQEPAKSEKILLAIPSNKDVTVFIIFYKDNIQINNGTAYISSGQTENIELQLEVETAM